MSDMKERRVRSVATACLFLCSMFSVFFGFVGLQSYNIFLTIMANVLFAFGIGIFILGMLYPFKSAGFWFSFFLESLGKFGLLSKISIKPASEGAIIFSFLLMAWGMLVQTFSGNGSYVLNDLSTNLFLTLVFILVFSSIAAHMESLNRFSELGKICENIQTKTMFENYVKGHVSTFNRLSLVLFFFGLIFSILFPMLWFDVKSGVIYTLPTYNITPYSGSARFGLIYPLALTNYFVGKIWWGVLFGVFALAAGIVLLTTALIFLIDTEKFSFKIDIYNSQSLDPAERLINTFWLLTGIGLLFVPYMTVISIGFGESGFLDVSRWEAYMSWTYIIFFTGLFFFSLVKYFSFVGKAKKPIEIELLKEMKATLENNGSLQKDKLAVIKMKFKLLNRFKGKPNLATFLQLVQILVVITLNLILNLLT
jgi:hypothetical protein